MEFLSKINNPAFERITRLLLEIKKQLENIIKDLNNKKPNNIIIKNINDLIKKIEDNQNISNLIIKDFNQILLDNSLNIHKTKQYSAGKYIGEFKNGMRDGKGIFYYNDGARYEGDYKNDKREGKGIMYYNTGNIYQGDYTND